MLQSNKIEGKVMIIDDILATGGTLNAVGELLTEHWGIKPKDQTHAVIANLNFLPGAKLLKSKKYVVESMVEYY